MFGSTDIKTFTEIQDITIKTLFDTGIVKDDTPLVVACSGGPDSTALLHVLFNSSEIILENVLVAHLNHDFRGQEAEDDAEFVKNMAANWNLSYRIGRADPLTYQNEQGISSFEQAARELRYTFLRDVARDVGAPAVLLGHTLDDLAETVLGHIIRGTGLQGLVGMEVCNNWPFPYDEDEIMIIRPMLDIAKSETESYCSQLDVTFRRDSGNYSHRFTRNRIRHSLLPELAIGYNPGIKDALVRLSRIASENLEFIGSRLEEYWKELCVPDTNLNCVTINLVGFVKAPINIQKLLLRKAYEEIIGNTTRLQENHIDHVVNQLNADSHTSSQYKIADWPNNIKILYRGEILVLSKGELSNQIAEEILVDISELPEACDFIYRNIKFTFELMEGGVEDVDFNNPNVLYLDTVNMPKTLLIRPMNTGDIFHPYGFGHELLLSDFFSKGQVNRIERQVMPILTDSVGTVWAVGSRISELGKVGIETKKVLRITRSDLS